MKGDDNTLKEIMGGWNPLKETNTDSVLYNQPQGEERNVYTDGQKVGKPQPQEEWEEKISPSNAETEQTVGENPTAEYVPGQFLEMFKKMNPYKPLTPEEAAAELKRQRRNRVFAALGDGLSAMHQAFSYAKGEQPMPSAMGGYSEKMRNRYERINKERLANDRAYMEGMVRAQQMDETARHNSELEKLRQQQQDRLDEETKIRREKADAYINYQNSLAAGNEAKAVYWKTKAELLEKGFSLDEAIKRATIAEKEAGARAKDAAAGASNAAANLSNTRANAVGQGKTTKTTYKRDRLGQLESSQTETSYNKGKRQTSTSI